MANVIRHKRGTSNPVAGDFSQTAELLVNTTDGGLFTKTDGGSVVEIGGGDLNVDSINFAGNGDSFITSTGVDSWTYRAEFYVGGEEGTPYDIAFKADGTKMYVTGSTGDDVNEYDLTTAWDITTASYLQKFSISAQEVNPRGLFFKPDGTKMYICGSTGDDVNEYTLSTAWNVTTASYVQNFNVSSKEASPNALAFKPDGTKMYITGSSSDSIHEYTLSTGWDISTASFNQTLSISAYSGAPEGLDFSDDGTEAYVAGRTYNRIVKYALSTAWDISTATFADYLSVSLLGDRYVNSISGVKVKSSVNRAYVCDYGVDRVFELTTNTPATEFDGTRLVVASDAHFREDVIIYSNLRVDDEIFCRQNANIDGTLSVRGAIDLADLDQVRFGSSDDWKLFYNGSTNVANVELEAAVVSLNVTDNGTDLLTLTKGTGVVALTATPTVNGSDVWHAGNDGSGSGLDADTVDGLQAASFIRSDTQDSVTGPIEFPAGTLQTYDPTSGTIGNDTATDVAIALGSGHRIVGHKDGYIRSLLEWNDGGDITIGQGTTTLIGGINFISGSSATNVKVNGNRILTTADEGSGNGLDADTLDGEQGSYYAPLASPTFTGTPAAPTASAGTNTTQLATTAFVQGALTNVALTNTAQSFTAQQTFAELKETTYSLTGTDIDPANGSIQTKTVAANTTFTESLEAGQTVVLLLNAGASYTITWPTLTWVTSDGNSAPTLTANDAFVFWKVSTTLYGAYVGSYA